MELEIRPHHRNDFPLGGILIKNPSANYWIKEIQGMQLSIDAIQIFPIPDVVANTIWGCLVIAGETVTKDQIGRHGFCQRVSANFFIPEKSILHPPLTDLELKKIVDAGIHIMHPEFGLVELSEELPLAQLLVVPAEKEMRIIKPQATVFIPEQIKSFQIQPLSAEEVMKNLEDNIFPKMEKMQETPLNIFEKIKLFFYKQLFSKSKEVGEGGNMPAASDNAKNLWDKIESLFQKISKKALPWQDTIQRDFEELEKRNRKQLDKLLDILKNNPMEALKYAIPLDEGGTSRGGQTGELGWAKRWFDFSLLGNNTNENPGSGSINLGDHFTILQNQYNETAEDLIKQKEYQKAAFVYMKLLKNHYKAAETLETGNYFQEAAIIYLKKANDKNRAAQCYEKGNMITDAIELYKELNQHEKVGDLYTSIHKRKEAGIYFNKVIEEYTSKYQYMKASSICSLKLQDESAAQALLLEGWRMNKDAVNCLNHYFSGIHDVKQLHEKINAIYSKEVTAQNKESFLKVLQHEYSKKNELTEPIREMAYQIIADQIPVNPSIVAELKAFNITDKELMKDTIRFKVSRRKH